MGHIPLLDEIAIIAALGVLATVILSRLRLPTQHSVCGARIDAETVRKVRAAALLVLMNDPDALN